MMFLILKMFVYLLLAAGIGGGAGWLIRNLQAQRTEELAQRAVHDAKAKLPQLESLLRSRDDSAAKLTGELKEARNALKQQRLDQQQLEKTLQEAQRETKRLQKSAEARQTLPDVLDVDGGDGTDDKLITELSQEITRLKLDLKVAREAVTGATPADSESADRIELEALQGQLATLQRNHAAVQGELNAEREKVRELERERELQNKSLQVLHQQLDLERSKRAAGANA